MAAINDACLGDSLTGFICLELSHTHIPRPPEVELPCRSQQGLFPPELFKAPQIALPSRIFLISLSSSNFSLSNGIRTTVSTDCNLGIIYIIFFYSNITSHIIFFFQFKYPLYISYGSSNTIRLIIYYYILLVQFQISSHVSYTFHLTSLFQLVVFFQPRQLVAVRLLAGKKK